MCRQIILVDNKIYEISKQKKKKDVNMMTMNCRKYGIVSQNPFLAQQDIFLPFHRFFLFVPSQTHTDSRTPNWVLWLWKIDARISIISEFLFYSVETAHTKRIFSITFKTKIVNAFRWIYPFKIILTELNCFVSYFCHKAKLLIKCNFIGRKMLLGWQQQKHSEKKHVRTRMYNWNVNTIMLLYACIFCEEDEK